MSPSCDGNANEVKLLIVPLPLFLIFLLESDFNNILLGISGCNFFVRYFHKVVFILI